MDRPHSLLTSLTFLLALSATFTPIFALPLNPASTDVILSQRQSWLNTIEKGYVAFGDSFAAGFGTGQTSTDSCRRGQFSYPKQLALTATGDIDFQNIACSGAVISDVLAPGGQIDSWTNPANSDIATISIGGNDVGFSGILDACLLQVMGGFGQVFKYDCEASIQKARAVMTGQDLYQDIFKALTDMITKSGREDFKIYYTGYPAFFNVDTTYCNDVTFFYASPHHRPLPIDDGYPYLSQSLRQELNDLVQSLNSFLSSLINDFNSQPQFANNQQVVFVATDGAFNGHRFCEEGVQEPDPARSDTWFFLSGWADNVLPGSTSGFLIEDLVTEGNATALPDPQTCNKDDNDFVNALQCRTAIGVTAAGSDIATAFAEDMALVAEGEFSEVRMPWWLPTRQGKTFHPRTLGHLAYRDAIISHF